VWPCYFQRAFLVVSVAGSVYDAQGRKGESQAETGVGQLVVRREEGHWGGLPEMGLLS